ncbi:MAG TPA: hypothetical protein VJA46_10030 [Acidimicrobiia bacterium]|nr:hypothetical protein [Acidimicrobiia bacterium]
MGPDQRDRPRVVDWLMEGDPAIRWQVLRDLEGVPEPVWSAEQKRVAREGWGARLLEHQGDDGRWTPWLYGKKWISTTYTLVLLRRMGMPPSERIHRSCQLFFDEAQQLDGGITASRTRGSRSEACVTGMVLAFLCWFRVDDPRRDRLVYYLLDNQMSDGGWNCLPGADHSSFHTTISVLEAWREYSDADGPRVAEAKAAEARGREFMLRHHLFKSHRTGEVVDKRMLGLSFPPRWHHDVLRGLDYFWSAESLDDDRLGDAIAVVQGKRRKDGRWLLQQRWPGETWFEMERAGEPRRWNTLRAMRVLEARKGGPADGI